MRFKYILFAIALFTFFGTWAKNNFNLKTIVIDAGHGGKDPGAVGYDKTYEKDVALAVALKFGAYIQKNFPDVKVIYTRKTDEFLELHQRAEIANKAKADLFIAIHCNSSTNNEFYGTSSYILGLHRTEANLEVAKRENSVISLEEDQDKHYEFNPNTPEGHIIMSMKQNAFLDQSIDFAAKIESQLENYASRKSMGVKQAGFYVLYKTAMPSLLAEIGFISNPEEEKYLNSARGQDQIASALFNAFKDYKTEMEGVEGEANTTTIKPDDVPVAPVKKDTPVVVKTTPTETPAPKTIKETAEVSKEIAQPVKETPPPIIPPVIKDTVVTPVVVKETPPAPVPETKKETVPVIETKADPDYVTLSDGTKIKKPVEKASGGGKGTSISEIAFADEKPTEIKESKSTSVTPSQPTAPKPAPINSETKKAPAEIKTTTPPIKTEVKTSVVTKTVETKTEEPAPPTVISNKHPLVPLIKTESGTIFKIQLFSLKGELKEYDRFMKLFTVLTAEELSNGITRYYGAKTKSLADAKKFLEVAHTNGFKDAYIVGFKDGKRMSSEELKAYQGE